MEPLSTGSNKQIKVYARIGIFILGIGIFISLLLVSVTASLAQGAVQPGRIVAADYRQNAAAFKQTVMQLETATATPTDTPTETATSTSTDTPTATGTSTNTPTGTSTATATSTSTMTPTSSGTPPTPTVTGTLVDNPTLSVSVSPASAKINETFTFTIIVGNAGTGASHNNNVINSSFPSYIVVSTVTTSKGLITKLTRSFTVYIGDLAPGEQVTIIAIVTVIASPSQNETQTDTVTLTYDVGQSKTASRTYQVLSQTLPPTGDLPLNWRGERITYVGMIPGILMMALGIILLIILVWSKGRKPKDKLWMAVVAALLILVGFIASATSYGLFTSHALVRANLNTPTAGGMIAQAQPADTSPTSLPWRPASAYSTPDSVIPIVTLPNYPIPTPKVTITPKPGEAGPDLSPITRIVIPSMVLDTIVKYVPYDGFSWMISGLRQEVAWMGNTSWPGLGGNTGLAGHVTVAGIGDGPFRHLNELPTGELVLLYTEKNIYTYQVRESRVTDGGDMSVILPTNNPQISLITCVDWDEGSRTYVNRLVVVADLVRTEPIIMGASH